MKGYDPEGQLGPRKPSYLTQSLSSSSRWTDLLPCLLRGNASVPSLKQRLYRMKLPTSSYRRCIIRVDMTSPPASRLYCTALRLSLIVKIGMFSDLSACLPHTFNDLELGKVLCKVNQKDFV
jgi:hypothetical protein